MKKTIVLLITIINFTLSYAQHSGSASENLRNTSSEKEECFYSLVYHAGSFKEPRYSASYGFMDDFLNIKNSPFGATFGCEGNWGLAPKDMGGIALMLGPNVGWAYGANNDVRFYVPVTYCLGMVNFKYDTLYSHTMVMLPTVQYSLNSKVGIRLGLSLTTDFSNFNTGFVVGLAL